jgi:hypothetical protein
MSSDFRQELLQALAKIDRPGSLCTSGSVPVLLPGLEVDGLGPVGLPLTARQAKELKELCEQAPYGKGQETLVDISVRRVWRLKPDHFSLTNPDWTGFLQEVVGKVQEDLGLEKQKLESHLHELLLYEPGSFFLPHRDGEKLDRMVATLVVVLPSSFEGGELVVRHDGQERTIDLCGDDSFQLHYAAFYADCEHEIRPLRKGHRLCLVYNLTLKKGKKPIRAPRGAEHVERLSQALRDWVEAGTPRKLAITLDHQYTQEGLTWDALKGVDRARANALLEAAGQADCQAYLALLTFHESGSAVDDGSSYGYGRWGYDYDDEDEDGGDGEPGDREMDEVFETSLTADHWSDSQGNRLPFGEIPVGEDELLDPEALREVEPEEEFEGYTGNEGMTLERWYRHAVVLVWPNQRHFEVLCGAGSRQAVESLKLLVKRWEKAPKKRAADLRAECIDLASAIIATWKEQPYAPRSYGEEKPEADQLLPLLARLDEPKLVRDYLTQVLARDVAVEPGKALVEVCRKHGWTTFQPELEAVFQATTAGTLHRSVRMLEHFCVAKPRRKEGWAELCTALARATLSALEAIDRETVAHDWRVREVGRSQVLAGLARSLLASGQDKLLGQLVTHALDRPETYPLRTAHVPALIDLGPWLEKHVEKPPAALSHWLASCCEQLEAHTNRPPQPPADFRRDAALSCHCAACGELKRFLEDPNQEVYHYRAREDQRRHLENSIRQGHCDLDLRTERRGSPYTLVCTKNTASYKARLQQYHQDQDRLLLLRSIELSFPE